MHRAFHVVKNVAETLTYRFLSTCTIQIWQQQQQQQRKISNRRISNAKTKYNIHKNSSKSKASAQNNSSISALIGQLLTRGDQHKLRSGMGQT
jgi:hypothetical protein